jgi:exonuclease III
LRLLKKSTVKFIKEIKLKLCLQETEIQKNMNHNLISFRGFNLKNETSTARQGVGCYANPNAKYVRQIDQEGVGLQLIILDVKTTTQIRIIILWVQETF